MKAVTKRLQKECHKHLHICCNEYHAHTTKCLMPNSKKETIWLDVQWLLDENKELKDKLKNIVEIAGEKWN